MKLAVVAVFVSEHALGAKHALLSVVERPAVLRLELRVVALDSLDSQLVLSVGISAGVLVPTLGRLNPVLAQFSLCCVAICVYCGDGWSRTLGLCRR